MNTHIFKLTIFIVLCLLTYIPAMQGQNDDETETTVDQEELLTSYFDIISRIPQEKLYLHLDKPYYGAGESIWFKGYLINSITHLDNTRRIFTTV